MKNYFIGFIAVFIFTFVSYHFWTAVNFDNINYIKIAGQNIKVDLAMTPEAQVRGLSERIELKANEGMLFVFDYSNKYSFWMKDMNFPIDIIWIGENLRVVYIKKDAQPESYPESYEANQDAKYVLEVVAGFADKNNLREGDKVKFL